MSSQSPIFVKTETFLLWLMQHTVKFPRHERFRLAKRIDDAAFELHECLLWAVQSHQPHDDLLRAGVALNKLRTYMLLAKECDYTTNNQYGYAAQQINEIGRLLGGWRKSIRHDQSA